MISTLVKPDSHLISTIVNAGKGIRLIGKHAILSECPLPPISSFSSSPFQAI